MLRKSLLLAAAWLCATAASPADLADAFRDPPQEARPRVFWTWLHAFDKDRITFELEEMKKKGIGGFLHWESGPGPSRYGTRAETYPHGPAWMSPEWRGFLLHVLKEADRLDLEASLALTPGANCGGPWITPELSAQKLVFSSTAVTGPVRFSEVLPLPDVPLGKDGKPLCYRDIAVFAGEPFRPGHSRYLVEGAQLYPVSDPSNVPLGNPWVDVTDKMDASGKLTWDVPPGYNRILRMGYSTTAQPADYFQGKDGGYYADHMRADSVELNFKTMLSELFGDGPLPRSLKYVHCDSYEVYGSDWTPKLLDEFRRRRGYDPMRFLPTLEGGNVDTRAITARFRADLNKTRSDCFADHHYQLLSDLTHARGIGFHSESAGPRVNPIDGLKVYGRNDIPMGEFWLEADTHRVTEDERFYVKMAASAAHIYGKRFTAAEAFTSLGRHWEEDPWSLKRAGDQAFLEGVNRVFIHTFSHSPEKFGKPGIEYFAGTHFSPNNTWWDQARAWTDYLARCQYLLSQGHFVADVLYYYGDQVPGFVVRKHVDPSLGAGYDYDVTNAEVILGRMSVRDGRIVLPDGMSYRVLVLPDWKSTQLDVLRKIGELVKAGATVVGGPPSESSGLEGYPGRDAEVVALASEIWGRADGKAVKENRYGQGRVIWGKPLREVLADAGVAPDFEVVSAAPDASLDAIHRDTRDAGIYFVVNKSDRWEEAECAFRTAARAPELWDPATGERRPQPIFRAASGRTIVPLRLAPRGSIFVVFRGKPDASAAASIAKDGAKLFPAKPHLADAQPAAEVTGSTANSVALRVWKPGRYTLRDAQGRSASVPASAPPAPSVIAGPWTVRFQEGRGAPASAAFPTLVSWTTRPEPGIKYFSGTATYETTFDAPAGCMEEGIHSVLNLGEVANLAEVRLNGQDLGVLWKLPFRVADIGKLLRPKGNRLEIRVTNLWVNRLIGDEVQSAAPRITNTNMFKFTANSPLRTSGLLGPVRIEAARDLTATWGAAPRQ
ncbi:MAG TPA: glycosyl hydrolase [Bryobacteraceae bacterium]|nr:glycosyl hydrolase [Bryobacteraceae bacterium]